MYNDLMINTYLAPSDSDFSEHDSVSSDKIKYYERKYNNLYRGNNELRIKREEEK